MPAILSPRGRCAVLGALLACGACNGALSSPGLREPNVAAPAKYYTPAAGQHDRAILGIHTMDLHMEGFIDLFPPPAEPARERPASQADLISERHLVVTVRMHTECGQTCKPRVQDVEIWIRGHAVLDGAPSPATAVAGLTQPAVHTGHTAEILIWPGPRADGGEPERLHFTGSGGGPTLADDAGRDNLLSYDLDAALAFDPRVPSGVRIGFLTADRIERVRRLVALSQVERERVADLSRAVAFELRMLDEYRAARGRGYARNFFDRTDELLRVLGWHVGHRQWEDPALGVYRDALAELFVDLANARDTALASRPGPKSVGRHLLDVLMVVPHVAGSVVDGVVETGRMARDLGTYTTAVFGEAVGLWEFDWEPWSAVGQAYAAGQSTGQIAWGVIDGIADSVDAALYAAENGDYAPLMNLGGEVTVELLLAKGLGQTAKAAKLARAADHAAAAGVRVADRWQRVLARSRAMRAKAGRLPARARDELDALLEAFTDALTPKPAAAAAAGPGDALEALATLHRSYGQARHARAKARALATLERLDPAARPRARAVLDELERHATTPAARDAAVAVYGVLDDLAEPADFLASLERTLALADRFDGAHLTGLVYQATRASAPADFLDDVRWLAALAPEPRNRLAALAAAGRAPDLTWLRAADLDPGSLELLALDPATNWAHLQRRAQLADGLPEEVRAVIGQRIDDLPRAPAGTEFWTPKKGQRQLRWRRDQATGRPALTLDSHGHVVVGGADDLNRAALGRNMRRLAPKLPDHQDHHLVPIEVARDHELFRAARARGEPRWDPNLPNNGVQLPTSAQARDKIAASRGLPIHNASHSGYSRRVKDLAQQAQDLLEAEYGSLDKVPAEELSLAAIKVEDAARAEILGWTTLYGEHLQ